MTHRFSTARLLDIGIAVLFAAFVFLFAAPAYAGPNGLWLDTTDTAYYGTVDAPGIYGPMFNDVGSGTDHTDPTLCLTNHSPTFVRGGLIYFVRIVEFQLQFDSTGDLQCNDLEYQTDGGKNIWTLDPSKGFISGWNISDLGQLSGSWPNYVDSVYSGGEAVLVNTGGQDYVYIFGGGSVGGFTFDYKVMRFQLTGCVPSGSNNNCWETLGKKFLENLNPTPLSANPTAQNNWRDCLAGQDPIACDIHNVSLYLASATVVGDEIYFIGGALAGTDANVAFFSGIPNRLIIKYNIPFDTYSIAPGFITVDPSADNFGFVSSPDSLAYQTRYKHKGINHNGIIYITGGAYKAAFDRQYLYTICSKQQWMDPWDSQDPLYPLLLDPCNAYIADVTYPTSNYDAIRRSSYTWTYDTNTGVFNRKAIPNDPALGNQYSYGALIGPNESTAELYNNGLSQQKIFASIDSSFLGCPIDFSSNTTSQSDITATLFSLDLNNVSQGWVAEDRDTANLIFGTPFSAIDSTNSKYYILGGAVGKDGALRTNTALDPNTCSQIGYNHSGYYLKVFNIGATLQPTLTVDPVEAAVQINEQQTFTALYDSDGAFGSAPPVTLKNFPPEVAWTSSNWAKADITFGTARGKEIGDTTITATYNSPDTGNDLTATALLHVLAFPPVTAAISADATSVADGGSTNVFWTVTNSLNCQITANGVDTGWWSSTADNVGTHPTGPLSIDTTYLISCVGDGISNTASDSVIVSVTAGNQPPIANAGGPYTVTDMDSNGTEPITLDGSGSTDPDGIITSYIWEWTENGSPLSMNGAIITHSFPIGAYTVTLTVTDNNGVTDSDVTSVTVSSPPPSGACFSLAIKSGSPGKLTFIKPDRISQTTTLRVTFDTGFSGTVAFSVAVPVSGILNTAVFSPPSRSTSGTTNLNMQILSGAREGDYTATVTASGGGCSRTLTIPITITNVVDWTEF